MKAKLAIFLSSAVASLSLASAVAAQNKPTIGYDVSAPQGPVSQKLFGANHRWFADAAGSADPKTGLTYPTMVRQAKDLKLSVIRYPAGMLGNLFDWERAIGPQARRRMQVAGNLSLPTPTESTFGPDEYGDLLDQTGAAGNLMVNFATKTAADAANFTAYMSLEAGVQVSGVDWGARRASNGHAAPYPIEWVEIGNEYDPAFQSRFDQNYWIKGEPVQIRAECAADKIACLYAFGGATKFSDQLLVRDANWTPDAGVGDGTPMSRMQIRYAPVMPGSEVVSVDGKAWSRVADIQSAAAGADVYQIDSKTGWVTFGDGQHGRVPPKGLKVTASYTSGPHEGFVDFYKAIKAANPKVKVCSSVWNESFIRAMGSANAYDCLAQHLYAYGSRDATYAGPDDFFIHNASLWMQFDPVIKATRKRIEAHAGARAKDISLYLSEYGQLGVFPDFARHFGRSEGFAVLNAVAIRAWVLNGVEAAGRHSLTDFTFSPAPNNLAKANLADADVAGDFALIGGPAPGTIVTPPGAVLTMLRDNLGTTLIPTTVTDVPELTASTGSKVPALLTYATLGQGGAVYLVVINLDPARDVTASVNGGAHGAQAQVSTMASPNFNDENNPQTPQNVTVKKKSVSVGAGAFDMTFPKHSVTAIALVAAG